MIFQGQGITCKKIDNDIAELCFDLKDASVNKFNASMLGELHEALNKIIDDSSLKGVLITSAKTVFIVGADITEFLNYFSKDEQELYDWLESTNQLFCRFEDLEIPTLTAINGIALGGGLEFPLSTCFRVASTKAKIGLPETKLGIFPGWGGTTRLPRLIGADNAIEWIASGKQYNAKDAFTMGVVDAITSPDDLRQSSLDMLNQAIEGKLDWQSRRDIKRQPLKLNPIEASMVFEGAKAFVGAQAGPHYPAPIAAIDVMQQCASLNRDEALKIEQQTFVKIAKTPVAASLVNIFLGDQAIKKTAKSLTQNLAPVKSTAVLGAGIMGGGIAYQSASKGINIRMKDINEEALSLGFSEAGKLLNKLISLGRMDNKQMIQVLDRIRPTLNYQELTDAEVIVEAVVENPDVKKSVLKDIENTVNENTVIASNTSTISITDLATVLQRPANFCGMHFFNPVHRMPLVEIIRGEKTSDETIAKVVNYAVGMGKSPIVVNDCPGFLVNRVLFPYFGGFVKLLNEGIDFKLIDKTMERFGWPMGPAYLLDVVGIDTCHHGSEVMANAYPDRMKYDDNSAIAVFYENKRLGQKNNVGFYQYTLDKKGKPKKQQDPSVYDYLAPLSSDKMATDEIIDRMMLPMIIESARCLEDNIVDSATMLDMALVYGIGFPPFLGGIFRYVDSMGIAEICQRAKKYEHLGKLYHCTDSMKQMAEQNKNFHS
ncbi:MAG: fatty acid oxidation complex subunit alpha FadB [Methylococcales bacterium]|nr:fatty acid oxidation complex subunit alpha FadB [Methylococcales bacterium]MBT7411031.1 fatty acid oxidation complex subunit alpha FadB [Methylococcales bacterium]